MKRELIGGPLDGEIWDLDQSSVWLPSKDTYQTEYGPVKYCYQYALIRGEGRKQMYHTGRVEIQRFTEVKGDES